MDPKTHWDQVYGTKSPLEVSWYQESPRLSLALIERVAPDRHAPVLDVGGGASALVDYLLADGYDECWVLDVAAAALESSRSRLAKAGAAPQRVHWITGNVLDAPLPRHHFAVWHDRAVFHFLTDADDRRRYVHRVRDALLPGGAVVIATFALDGPRRCSGLDVAHYDAPSLQAEFGPDFVLEHAERELHRTPTGAEQAFTWCVLRHVPAG